jgi:hypothetical protein
VAGSIDRVLVAARILVNQVIHAPSTQHELSPNYLRSVVMNWFTRVYKNRDERILTHILTHKFHERSETDL